LLEVSRSFQVFLFNPLTESSSFRLGVVNAPSQLPPYHNVPSFSHVIFRPLAVFPSSLANRPPSHLVPEIPIASAFERSNQLLVLAFFTADPWNFNSPPLVFFRPYLYGDPSRPHSPLVSHLLGTAPMWFLDFGIFSIPSPPIFPPQIYPGHLTGFTGFVEEE